MALADNTIERICKVFRYLVTLEKKGVEYASSRDIAKAIGATEYMVRKDISILEAAGYSRKGYEVRSLREALARKAGLGARLKACIVGLGRLGTALADYKNFPESGFEIVAGFDKSVNKLERIQTGIDVFPDIRMKEVIKQKAIELGIITVPAESAQDVADKLVDSGISGILNFSPVNIEVPAHVVHLDMDFTDALRFIAAKIGSRKKGNA